jgi:DNA invertase Pin-like site-specific DNA recombinase
MQEGTMAVTITRFDLPDDVPMDERAAVWGRVSTTEQHTENQVPGLVGWARRKGLHVAVVFAVEDSASREGQARGKGLEFDKARDELIRGARLGYYGKVLIQHTNRLTRRGMEDTLRAVRLLREGGADTWSMEEPWLNTHDDSFMDVLVGLSGWKNQAENEARSAAIKRGLARRRADLAAGRQVKGRQQLGGRIAGSRNRNPAPEAKRAKVSASWTPERRAAQSARIAALNKQRTAS